MLSLLEGCDGTPGAPPLVPATRLTPKRGRMTFDDAFRAHYRSVVASSWAICRDREVAEELAQEAFARAYRRWRRLEDGGYAVPWLHRVVMNLSLNHVRRRERGSFLERLHPLRPAHDPATVGGQDWLVATLRRLPERQREAVFLRYVADLDVARVAALMGCSPGAVKTHSKRGLDRLREVVPPEGGHVQFAAATQEPRWMR